HLLASALVDASASTAVNAASPLRSTLVKYSAESPCETRSAARPAPASAATASAATRRRALLTRPRRGREPASPKRRRREGGLMCRGFRSAREGCRRTSARSSRARLYSDAG